MTPCLIFRSLNHFEFIFVYGVRECSSFIHLDEAVQLSQHPLLKRLFSTLRMRVWVYFWAVFCSIDPYVFVVFSEAWEEIGRAHV